jgi:hypothetical protein
MLGFGRFPVRKSEAGSLDIPFKIKALRPSVYQHRFPQVFISICTSHVCPLSQMDRRDMGQMETLTCLHSGPDSQTQPWKRVPCKTFDTELEQKISSPESSENLGLLIIQILAVGWLLLD